MPLKKALRALVCSAAKALGTLLYILLILLLLIIIFQFTEMLEATRVVNRTTKVTFCRDGDTITTCHLAMIRQSFSAIKKKGTLRIFIVGSSQAMGSPYVNQDFNRISRIFPNEGGLATWLKDYLAFAMPGRPVEVINAAMGMSFEMKEHLETLRGILALGSPDIIVVMGGNNERLDDEHRRAKNAAQRDEFASKIYPAYLQTIQTMAREASAAGVRTIFVTLPSNIRDWAPRIIGSDPPLFLRIERFPYKKHPPDLETACRELRAKGTLWSENPRAHFSLARCLESEGDIKHAYAEYIAARDLDYQFFHIRSIQNNSLRTLRGPGVSVLDLETLFRGYAYDGIPGDDLFHDFCHMTLRGNKIAGFEIARAVLRLEHCPFRDEELRRAPLRHLSLRTLWWLYWFKTVKWTFYRFLPPSWQTFGPIGDRTAQNFLQSMRDLHTIDSQIELLQSDVWRDRPK